MGGYQQKVIGRVMTNWNTNGVSAKGGGGGGGGSRESAGQCPCTD